jgi:recombinational DNA repair protein RecT
MKRKLITLVVRNHRVVYKNDVFKVTKGSDSKIIHEPDYFSDRGELKGGYWIATLLNGQKPFGVMPIQRINEIKARSESVKSGKGSPWDTDFNEMAKKTILNWGFKSLPKTNISASVLKSMEADSQLDNEEFDEWRKNQEEVNTDDFDDDASPEDNFTEAVVVEEEPDTSGEKAPLPTTPVPKDKPDPIQRIKDMKEQSESSTNEDERVVFDEKGNPIVVTVDKEIQPGLFPEV